MATLKIKATKSMADAINEFFRQKNLYGYSAKVERLNELQFAISVDPNIYMHECDYSEKTELFTVLKISYSAEYYAIPKYLTSYSLLRIYRRSDKTFNGFFNKLFEEIEI